MGQLIGIDYMNRKDLATLKCFKQAGVDVLLRYYYPTEPKSLGPDEMDDISKIGFTVIPVWETTGGAGSGAGYFTRYQGVQDATGALGRAKLVNQPKGTHIYFAVDTAISSPSDITEYFNGVYDTLTPEGYKTGCYGYWPVVQYGLKNWPGVTAFWQTYGSDPGQNVIWQYEQDNLCGAVVDMNRVPEELAQWKVGGPVTISKPTYVGQSVTNINLTVGEVGQYDAIYNYGDRGNVNIVGKVVAYQPGVRLVTVYPPVDPDADPTLELEAQPAYFVVATR